MNPVEISHLTKHYPDFSLNDVTFSVPAGYVTGFVGANGSGKTTTIKAALGMIHPDSGSATTVGHERIGVVFDAPPYNPEWRLKDLGRGIGRFEQDAARHAVVNQGAAHAAAVFGDFRAARGGGPERGFVGSERDADGVVHGVTADGERPDPLGRDRGDVGLLAGHILLVLQEFSAQKYSTRAFSLRRSETSTAQKKRTHSPLFLHLSGRVASSYWALPPRLPWKNSRLTGISSFCPLG